MDSVAKQGFILGINVEDSKMSLKNAKFFESTIGSSVTAIASIFGGIYFLAYHLKGK